MKQKKTTMIILIILLLIAGCSIIPTRKTRIEKNQSESEIFFSVESKNVTSKTGEPFRHMLSRINGKLSSLAFGRIIRWRQTKTKSRSGSNYLFGIGKYEKKGNYVFAVTRIEENYYFGLWILPIGIYSNRLEFPQYRHIYFPTVNNLMIHGEFNVFYAHPSNEVAYARLMLNNGRSVKSYPYKKILLFIVDGDDLASVPTSILAYSKKHKLIYGEVLGKGGNKFYVGSKKVQSIKLDWL